MSTNLNTDPKSSLATKKLVLEEQRRAFDAVGSAASALDTKLQALFGSASLIISLVSTIQIAVLRQSGGALFWFGLASIVALYIWMVNVVITGLTPLEYYTPISNSWDELDEQYFTVSENEAYDQQISNYLRYTEANRALNFDKIRSVSRATNLFRIILVLLLVSMTASLNA